MENKKNVILGIATVLIVVIAIVVVVFVPGGKKESNNNKVQNTVSNSSSQNNKTASKVKNIDAVFDEEGNFLLEAEELSTSSPTFIKADINGTTVELVAVKDSKDVISIAFNTCQSCNGAPLAYFKYSNSKLVCQNCKNEFPLSSIGKEANGCNPWTITSEEYETTDTGIKISKAFLEDNVMLFSNIKEH